MAYLDKSDYTLRISVEHLDQIIEQGILTTSLTADNFRNNAESWATAVVKSYLSSQYNIAGEYAIVAPAPRNFQIMQITIDLALCTMHKTINPRDVPEHIAIACDEAVAWLKDARDSKVIVDLPSASTDPAPLANSFIESQPKFISKPYQDLSILHCNE